MRLLPLMFAAGCAPALVELPIDTAGTDTPDTDDRIETHDLTWSLHEDNPAGAELAAGQEDVNALCLNVHANVSGEVQGITLQDISDDTLSIVGSAQLYVDGAALGSPIYPDADKALHFTGLNWTGAANQDYEWCVEMNMNEDFGSDTVQLALQSNEDVDTELSVYGAPLLGENFTLPRPDNQLDPRELTQEEAAAILSDCVFEFGAEQCLEKEDCETMAEERKAELEARTATYTGDQVEAFKNADLPTFFIADCALEEDTGFGLIRRHCEITVATGVDMEEAYAKANTSTEVRTCTATHYAPNLGDPFEPATFALSAEDASEDPFVVAYMYDLAEVCPEDDNNANFFFVNDSYLFWPSHEAEIQAGPGLFLDEKATSILEKAQDIAGEPVFLDQSTQGMAWFPG